MADWYLAPSLAQLRAEINRRWPGRDRTSDGTIGDAAHQAGASDHNPNSRGSVNAIDVDEDGIDPWAVIAAVQQHPSAHYWIYERTIADRDDGWRRRAYTGSNPHDKHLHVSIRQSREAEQDTRPWGLLEDQMLTDDQAAKLASVHAATFLGGSSCGTTVPAEYRVDKERSRGNAIVDKLNYTAAKLDQAVAELAALRTEQATPIDYDQLADAIVRRVLAGSGS